MAVGDLVVNLVTKTDRFTKPLKKARGALSSFAGFARTTVMEIAKVGAVAGAGLAAVSLAAVKLAADAEQTAISFEVMTGNIQIAQKLISDLRAMGAGTPFEFRDLSGATKILLNFGRTSDQVLDDLDMLSNVAAGDAQKLGSLALVFGQIAANQKLMGQDLLQLINTGFNPLQQIAERTGETMTELRDRMSRGKIGFDEVRQAFADATSEGGRFFQMNEKQSKTLLGRWSTLKDGVTSTLISLGESIMENMDLNGVILQVTELGESFKNDFLPAITELIKQLPKLTKILNEGVLGREAGNQLEKIAFTISAIRQGIGPEEAGRMFARIKQAEKDAPFTREAGAIGDEAQKALDESQRMADQMAAQAPMIQRAQEQAMDFIAAQREKGVGERRAIEMFGNRLEEAAEAAGRDIPEFLREWFDEFKQKQFDILERQENAVVAKAEQDAERMLAGFVRKGIEGLQSGVMSLGGGRREEQFRNQAGTLDVQSREAFDAMRATVGAPEKQEIEKAQLAQQEKTNQKLEKLVQALTQKGSEFIEVRGI